MNFINKIISQYKKIEKHIYQLIVANFFLQLINASFFVLGNYFLINNGFSDIEIAKLIEYRFFSVMLIVFPLGLYIKGRKLKPLFILSAFGTPSSSLLFLYGVETENILLIKVSLFLAGSFFVMMQATVLPYILLNAKKEVHSESIAMHFQTWVLSTIFIGLSYFIINKFIFNFDERMAIFVFTLMGYLSIFFILKIQVKENITTKFPICKIVGSYDWSMIIKALVPTTFIAIGAGFTIPFISLFFEKVHGVSSSTFSFTASCTFILVFIGMGIMPSIKKRFGYKMSIIVVQSLSVCFLVLMATTQFYAHLPYAAGIALFFYIIRQPLMNVAGPMTSELTMYFVGEKNQELISALTASIWSGSWFFSSKIFAILRQLEVDYVYIFLTTASMYLLGIIWYNFLINEYYKHNKQNN